jgi:hypothetical protein
LLIINYLTLCEVITIYMAKDGVEGELWKHGRSMEGENGGTPSIVND